MKNNNWHGIFNVMITPFDKYGDIDYDGFKNNLLYSQINNSNGVIIAGSTGEFYNLEDNERISLFEIAKEVLDDNTIIIGGCTSLCSTKNNINLISKSYNTGIDGIMLLPPLFLHPNDVEVVNYFEEISQNTDCPIMVYNNPVRTGVLINNKMLGNIIKNSNVIAIKDSSKDLSLLGSFIEDYGNDISIFTGFDTLIVPSIAIGADGVASMTFQVFANIINNIYQNIINGNIKESSKLQNHILPLYHLMYNSNSSPYAVIKESMNLNKLNGGYPRKPLRPVNNLDSKYIKTTIDYILSI